MKKVYIYQEAKKATQSGHRRTRGWVLEFIGLDRPIQDITLGWMGTRDTRAHLKIMFKSLEEALAFAGKEGYDYEIIQAPKRDTLPKSYADNFLRLREVL